MNDNTKQIKWGAIISYLMIAVNIVLGLIYTPWILRKIGSSHYGLYTISSSITALFLMDFGMSAAVTRFISNYRATYEEEKINAVVRMTVKFFLLCCAFSAVLLSIVFFNMEAIYGNLEPTELKTLKDVFLVTAFFVVVCFPVNICNGILNAFEKFAELKSLDVFNKLGAVFVTMIALSLNGGILSLVTITGGFNLVTFFLKIWVVRKKTSVRWQRSESKGAQIRLKEIFAFSAWSTVNGISKQMIFNLIPSILAIVANTLSVTLYGFANVIEGYVYMITQAINGLFMPQVSRILIGETDAKKTLPLMIRVGRLNQAVVSLLIMGFILIGREFIHLWVGAEYDQLYVCILFLIIPYFLFASQQIANTSILVLGHIKYSTVINLITGVLNLIVSYCVCQKYGVIGVCATIGIVFFVRIVLLNILYVRKLKLDVFAFFKACHLKMLPSFAVSYFCSALILHYLPEAGGWMALAFKGLIVVVVYAIVMWFIGLNAEEKKTLCSFRNSRK